MHTHTIKSSVTKCGETQSMWKNTILIALYKWKLLAAIRCSWVIWFWRSCLSSGDETFQIMKIAFSKTCYAFTYAEWQLRAAFHNEILSLFVYNFSFEYMQVCTFSTKRYFGHIFSGCTEEAPQFPWTSMQLKDIRTFSHKRHTSYKCVVVIIPMSWLLNNILI